MLKPIFKKVKKHEIFKINYYVIWTIFLKCSSKILLDLFLSLKNFFDLVVFFWVKDGCTYATENI